MYKRQLQDSIGALRGVLGPSWDVLVRPGGDLGACKGGLGRILGHRRRSSRPRVGILGDAFGVYLELLGLSLIHT